VRVTYYDTEEELFAKFKAGGGDGYDVIVPSDYITELLIKEGFLKPLDLSRISNFRKIDKRLLNKFFDPKNEYSVPVCWSPYGIAYDKKLIKIDDKNVSWGIIFEKEFLEKLGNYKITMLNDDREAIFLAAIYLFQDIENLTSDKLDKIKDLLIKQKQIVESYTESGAKYILLSKIAPMAVLPAGRFKEMGNLDDFGFVIPKEGSLMDLLVLAIPKKSKNADLAYKLIDFLLSDEVGAYNFEAFDFNPANKDSYKFIDERATKYKAFFPNEDIFNRLYNLNNKIPNHILENIWFSVKSS
jgi:spermidine/putrescine-binding protein